MEKESPLQEWREGGLNKGARDKYLRKSHLFLTIELWVQER